MTFDACGLGLHSVCPREERWSRTHVYWCDCRCHRGEWCVDAVLGIGLVVLAILVLR